MEVFQGNCIFVGETFDLLILATEGQLSSQNEISGISILLKLLIRPRFSNFQLFCTTKLRFQGVNKMQF